jgi:hypothetical protein
LARGFEQELPRFEFAAHVFDEPCARVKTPFAFRPQQQRAQHVGRLPREKFGERVFGQRARRDERRARFRVRHKLRHVRRQLIFRQRAPTVQADCQPVDAQIRTREDQLPSFRIDDGLHAFARQTKRTGKFGGVDFPDEFGEWALAQMTVHRAGKAELPPQAIITEERMNAER